VSALPLAVRIPSAIAGGKLKNLADVLWLHAQWSKDRRALLVIDPQLNDKSATDLYIINAKGTPITIPSGHHANWSATERASLYAAVRDRMPNTAEAEGALDLCLPRPEESLEIAAVELWQEVVADSGIEVVTSEQVQTPVEWLDCAQRPELLWVAPRHERALSDLGVDLSDALLGKQALESRLAARKHSEIPQFIEQLHTQLDEDLKRLKVLIMDEFPGMLGAWNRYRRAARRSIKQLERSTDRATRNRKGIHGSRLNGLAHALRPMDQSQEVGLGLLCAIASFRLDLTHCVKHSKAFHGIAEQSIAIVNIGTGNSSTCSLS